MKTLFGLLLLSTSLVFGQTKTEIKDALESVAKILQTNSKNYAFGKDNQKFYKICKTDYDETKLTLSIHFYYPDMTKYNSYLIEFAKLKHTNAIPDIDKNETTVHFGSLTDMVNKSEVTFISQGKQEIRTGLMFTITNDGEDFVWKKMKEKLETIRLYAIKNKGNK